MALLGVREEIRLKLQAFCDENGVSLTAYAGNCGDGYVDVCRDGVEIFEFESIEPARHSERS